MTGAVLLTLCSCFSRTARVEHFGKSLTAEYGQANDGSEYVDIRGDMKHNSALIMPNIKFSAEQDTIHIDVELTLVKKEKVLWISRGEFPCLKELTESHSARKMKSFGKEN